MSLEKNFKDLVISGKIEEFLIKDPLQTLSFIPGINKWETIVACNDWKLQKECNLGIYRILDSNIIKKISSSLEGMEKLLNNIQ